VAMLPSELMSLFGLGLGSTEKSHPLEKRVESAVLKRGRVGSHRNWSIEDRRIEPEDGDGLGYAGIGDLPARNRRR